MDWGGRSSGFASSLAVITVRAWFHSFSECTEVDESPNFQRRHSAVIWPESATPHHRAACISTSQSSRTGRLSSNRSP